MSLLVNELFSLRGFYSTELMNFNYHLLCQDVKCQSIIIFSIKVSVSHKSTRKYNGQTVSYGKSLNAAVDHYRFTAAPSLLANQPRVPCREVIECKTSVSVPVASLLPSAIGWSMRDCFQHEGILIRWILILISRRRLRRSREFAAMMPVNYAWVMHGDATHVAMTCARND